MLKITATLLVIFALFSFPFSHPVFAQTQVPAQEEVKVDAGGASGSAIDFKKVLAENDRQYRERVEKGDVKAMEKLGRQTPKGNGLTGRQKTYIFLGIIGFAALVFVLVKYGKDCAVYEPAGCTPSSDDNNCTCKQYKQNL